MRQAQSSSFIITQFIKHTAQDLVICIAPILPRKKVPYTLKIQWLCGWLAHHMNDIGIPFGVLIGI